MAAQNHDEAIDKIFTATLDALAAIDIFSKSTTPTSFVVYAHDADDDDDGSGPAHSDVVRKFIKWMNRVQTRTYSDQHPSGTFAHDIRACGDLANRDILGNQLCLLPHTSPVTGNDRVESVIVFGSPRLRKYCRHPFADGYMDAIKTMYRKYHKISDVELRRRLQQEVLKTATTQPGFHHVLTEIAFLELRRQYNFETHGIILVSFETEIVDYLRFTDSTSLQLNINALCSSDVLHSRFFKLLRVIYVANHAAIDIYARAYDSARAEFATWNEDGDLNHLIERFISRAQRDLSNYRNAELRNQSHKILLADLGAAAYALHEQRRNRVLSALPSVPYEDRKDRNPQRVDGTCLWFTRLGTFKDWRVSETGRILWVTAYPGCGKSVLLKHLVDTVLVAPGTTVCYFFFKDDFVDQMSLAGALRCLLHQLLCQRPELLTTDILAVFEQDQQLTVSISKLWTLLSNVTRNVQTGNVILVIDALDECDREDRRTFMHLLTRWSEDGASTRVKFLVSSRPYEDILRGFHGILSAVHLAAEEDPTIGEISKEIDLVIMHNLRRTAAYRELSPTQQHTLRRELTKVGNKTYLWAHLVQVEIDEMFETDTKSLLAAIQKLPQSVEKAYEKILSRSGDPERVKRMLSIILVAAVPLNLRQLAQAWALTQDVQTYSELEVASETQMRRTIRALCGLFVIVVDSKVYLIHRTARDFLLANSAVPTTRSTEHMSWQGSIPKAEAELVMAQICLRYLELYGTPLWDITWHPQASVAWQNECRLICGFQERQDYRGIGSLARYTIQEWDKHLLESQGLRNEMLVERVAKISGRLGQAFAFGSYDLDDYRAGNDPLSPLMVACMHGLLPVVRSLLQTTDSDLEQADRTGMTALGWAVRFRHVDVVRALVERGADCNTRDRDGFPVLLYAICKDEWAAAELLLAHGAEPESANSWGETALTLACRRCCLRTVRVLLKAGAHPSAADSRGNTALMLTCERDRFDDQGTHIKIAELLMHYGPVDVNACNHGEDTALSNACYAGRVTLIKYLLKLGATINARAMSHVVVQENSAVLQVLLDAGADVNTALHIAVERDHCNMVRLLALDRTAVIDLPNKDGATLLMTAVKQGHWGVAQILLSQGADTECIDACGRTALSIAAYHGDPDIVRLLLSHGAKVKHPDKRTHSALVTAALGGEITVVRTLVEAGADLVKGRIREFPAIEAAAKRGHWEIVELLLPLANAVILVQRAMRGVKKKRRRVVRQALLRRLRELERQASRGGSSSME